MTTRQKLIPSIALVLLAASASVAVAQRKAVERRAAGIRLGMTLAEVMVPLEGWWMVNTHPVDRSGDDVVCNGYSGDVYVLTPLASDGRETNLAKISPDQFTRELAALLSGGTQWTVYFNYRTVPTDAGILVRFDGHGRVKAVGAAASSAADTPGRPGVGPTGTAGGA